jgi:DNA-binding transcriptional regulator YiaG
MAWTIPLAICNSNFNRQSRARLGMSWHAVARRVELGTTMTLHFIQSAIQRLSGYCRSYGGSDMKAIRLALRMSQHHFAAAYRMPLPTLKNWEQGRRMPDAPAAAYLLAIKRRPKEIMEAVARA